MNTGEWMTKSGIDKWILKHEPKLITLRCPVSDCDPRLFQVSTEQLADADGWIECDVCGGACEEVAQANQPTPAAEAHS